MPSDNPYTKAPPVQSSSSIASTKEPLYGFLPRNVQAAQVTKALVSAREIFHSEAEISFITQEHDLNPFTKMPHTAQYRKILEMRKKLPVFTQMEDFYKMVSSLQSRFSAQGSDRSQD